MALIEAFALARNQLMKLAQTNLSVSQLKDLGWANASDPRHLIDSAAGRTLAKLKEMGVEYRESLCPGTAKPVYHNPWMNADVAEMLFEAGFTEIDEFDQDGITPLLLHTYVPEPGLGGRFPEYCCGSSTTARKTWSFLR